MKFCRPGGKTRRGTDFIGYWCSIGIHYIPSTAYPVTMDAIIGSDRVSTPMTSLGMNISVLPLEDRTINQWMAA